MYIATKTMCSKSKTILGHNSNDFGYIKHCQKIKYFSNITNMSNSVIFGGHLEICKLGN